MQNDNSLQNRLRYHAAQGSTQVLLRLYKKQAFSLLVEGFTLERYDTQDCFPGQIRYLISWSHARKDTFAYELLEIASQRDPQVWAVSPESPTEGGGWL